MSHIAEAAAILAAVSCILCCLYILYRVALLRRRATDAARLQHDIDCTCLDCQNTRWSRKERP